MDIYFRWLYRVRQSKWQGDVLKNDNDKKLVLKFTFKIIIVKID